MQYLKDHGYEPDHALTKAEAVQLIRQFGGHPASPTAESPAATSLGPFQYRQIVENAKRALEADSGDLPLQQQLARAITQREEFWLDTCREATEFHIGSPHVRELYRKHGCLFCTPTQRQVEEVLQALDVALPFWDRDNPELFYETLKLNFPELVRHH